MLNNNMTHQIDVHVLHLPDEREDWAIECNQSLHNEPINVHHLPGIKGDLRQGRYTGYQQGSAPYVSFVDPDDIVYPGTFQKCLGVLEQNPECCGVYTLSNIDYEDGRVVLNHPFREWSPLVQFNNILEVHQIVVMRRDLILKCYENKFHDMPLTAYHDIYTYMHLAMHNPWIAIDYIGYMWRKRNTGCHFTEGKNGLPPSVKQLRSEFKQLYQLT